MADYEHTATIEAPAQELFDFLADVRNLPRYFDGLVHAEAGEDEEVRIVAVVDDIQRDGTAWLHVDPARRALRWGSPGESEYAGDLTVDGDEESATVRVHLHTVTTDGARVDAGLRSTVEAVRRLVERGPAPATP